MSKPNHWDPHELHLDFMRTMPGKFSAILQGQQPCLFLFSKGNNLLPREQILSCKKTLMIIQDRVAFPASVLIPLRPVVTALINMTCKIFIWISFSVFYRIAKNLLSMKIKLKWKVRFSSVFKRPSWKMTEFFSPANIALHSA